MPDDYDEIDDLANELTYRLSLHVGRLALGKIPEMDSTKDVLDTIAGLRQNKRKLDFKINMMTEFAALNTEMLDRLQDRLRQLEGSCATK